jgi:hypothetical protein
MEQIAIPKTPVKFKIPRMQLVFANAAVQFALQDEESIRCMRIMRGALVIAEQLDSELLAITGVEPRGSLVESFDALEELSVELSVYSLVVMRVCIDVVASRLPEFLSWMGEASLNEGELLSNVRRFSYDVGTMIATAMQRGMEDFAMKSGSVTVH